MANQNINMVFGIQGHDVIARGMNQIERSVKKTVSETERLTGSLLDQANKLGMSEREYIKYTASLNGATRSQKESILSIYDSVQAKKREESEIAKLNAERDREQAELHQSQKAIQRIISALKEEEQMIGKTRDEIVQLKAARAGATQAQLDEIAGLQKSNKEKEEAIKKSGGLRRHLQFMRGGFGQVGHQVQDVAVQMQMGTDAMIIFGQQGSQIASLFGSGGAIIGAVISMGAAVSTYFTASMNDSSVAAKELEKVIGELDSTMELTAEGGVKILSQEFIELAKRSRDLAEIQLRGRLVQAQDVVKLSSDALIESMEGLNVKIVTTGRGVAASEGRMYKLTEAMGISRDQAVRLNRAIESFKNGTDGSADSLLVMINQLSKLPSATPKLLGMLAPIAEAAIKFKDAEDRAAFLTEALANLPKAIEDADNEFDGFNSTQTEYGRTADQIIDRLWEQSQMLDLQEEKAYSAAEAQIAYNLALAGMEQAAIDAQIALFRMNQEREKEFEPPSAGRGSGKTKEEKEAERQARNFAMVKRYYKSRADLVDEQHQSHIAILNKQYPEELRMHEDYLKLKEQIDNQHKHTMIISHAQTAASIIGTAQGSLQTLSEVFEESKGIGKAMFVANQALAIANAIMSAHAGAANAYRDVPAPYNIAVSKMILGLGYAQAGAIAGQTLASFEGGGITFSGVRSGGMDGKGGRMAVVHPNEKITDLEKDGGTGQPVNVQFTINAVDAKGIDQLLYERRGMITGIVQKAVNNVGRRIM